MKLSVVFSLLFWCVSLLPAQNAVEYQFRRAEIQFRSGNAKVAESLIKPVYQQNPFNRKYFRLYLDVLVKQRKFPDAINITKLRLNKYPNEHLLKHELAGFYFDLGQKTMALSTWDELIDTKLPVNLYVRIVNDMVRKRLFDVGIQFYKAAQTFYKNDGMFALNMARLYEYSIQIEKAVETYLDYGRRTKRNQSYIRRQILRLCENPDGLTAVMAFLRANPPSDALGTAVAADVFAFDNRFLEAFRLLKTTPHHIPRVLELARESAKLGADSVAIPIYHYVGQQNHALRYRGLEGWMNVLVNQPPPVPSERIDSIYHASGDDLMVARTYVSYLIQNERNLADAQQIIQTQLQRTPRIAPHLANAFRMQSGQIYLLIGQFDASRSAFENVDDGYDQGAKHVYLMALDMISGRSGNASLNAILQSDAGLKNTHLNDAMKVFFELRQAKLDSTSRIVYGRAFLYYYQKRTDRAVIELKKLLKTRPDYALSASRMMYAMYMNDRDYNGALRVTDAWLAGAHRAEWLVRKAKIQIRLNQNEAAKKMLREMILEFPTDFWTIEARKLLHELSMV